MRYVMAKIIDYRVQYWGGYTKRTKEELWGSFTNAKLYTQAEHDRIVKLAKGVQWVTALHGIGADSYYPLPFGWDLVEADTKAVTHRSRFDE